VRDAAIPLTPPEVPSRSRIRAELLIVLSLSLGASAVYSIVQLIDLLTRVKPLGDQVATINPPLSDRSGFDLTYQLLGIFFALAPVALVCFLLWRETRPRLARLGIDFTRPGRDALTGLALAVIVGVPGIGVYLAGRALGIGVTVVPTALNEYWWTVPVLALSALRAGLTEEVIVIGYLYARLGDLGWGRWRIILSTAVLRGGYHLYQGFGAFVGNFAMGVLFGWLYTRYGRLLPLIIAHTLIDIAIFVGYPWAAATFPGLFGH
jgi:membrane protease YdiL (CAAX protease family)